MSSNTRSTGSSIAREKVEELKKNVRIGTTEIFRRIKAGAFVQLLLQIAEVDSRPDGGPPEEKENGAEAQLTPFQSLVTGVGELQVESSNSSKVPVLEDSPFLLLDVRDKDEFEKSHITTAFSFPHTLLSRSDNYQIKEMLQYRNKVGKILLVYDDDERTAMKSATILVQRGYDNLFLLTGGLATAKRLFPDALTTSGASDDATNRFSKEDLKRLSTYLDSALAAEKEVPNRPTR